MAVTESREVVIEATPDEIMDVLNDLESLPKWSSAHQKVEILERDDQGRPSKSRQVVKIVGTLRAHGRPNRAGSRIPDLRKGVLKVKKGGT